MQSLHPLVGAWRLGEMFSENAQGQRWHIYGENPVGLMIFTENGYMSVTLMKPDRTPFPNNDLYTGTPAEIVVEAFQFFNAYCGSYTLDLENQIVTNTIQACKNPLWEGTTQTRYFSFEYDMLTIYTDPMHIDGEDRVIYLVWRKAE